MLEPGQPIGNAFSFLSQSSAKLQRRPKDQFRFFFYAKDIPQRGEDR
jgi:hypothetical protein